MQHVSIASLMTGNVTLIKPEATLNQAARKMASIDCGILPVGAGGGSLEGVITDRDIVIRALANGVDPNHGKVKDYMSPGVVSVELNATLEEAASLMNKNLVSRLIVMDNNKVAGILTFGSITRKCDSAIEIENVIECAIQGKKAA